MKKRSLQWGMILAVIPLIVSILACSTGIPIPVLKTATPTETATATVTNTPLPTFTPTRVPPPLAIAGCIYSDSCPTSNWIRSYLGDVDVYTNSTYYATIPYMDEVHFYYGWCTIDSPTLEENLKHMEFVFTIDGVSYLDKAELGYTTMQDNNDPNTVYPCYSIGVVLSGWKVGEPHDVTIGATFLEEIYDGWSYTSAGDYIYIYTVMPLDIPTPVPATPTFTPRPTSTYAPPPVYDTAVPPVYDTPVPPCDATGSITVTNDTDGWVSISFYGPANFNYGLASGTTQSFAVCPGTYDYTAWGCGGASDSGTASDGDSLSFYCTSP